MRFVNVVGIKISSNIKIGVGIHGKTTDNKSVMIFIRMSVYGTISFAKSIHIEGLKLGYGGTTKANG